MNAAAQPVTVNGVTAVYDGLGRVVETDSGNIAAGTDSRSSGSITIAGSEQMIPASLAAGASAVVTITGTEQSMPINLDTTVPDGCVPVVTTTAQYATCYDTGGGYLVILTYDASTGGFLSQSQYSFNYGVGDTAATISDRLAAAINADPAARLVATAVPGAPANQGMINVQLASASSTAVVYNVVAGFGCGDDFNSCSFSIDVPTQLAASQTSCKIPAVYDAGTVSVTVNNGPVASYAWSQSDSPVTIAQSLATAINRVYGAAGLSLVTASAPAGSTVVQLSSIGVGPTTNYPVATSVSYNSTDFQSSSFTTVAAGMAGGLLSVNGTSAGSTQYVYSPSGAKIAVLQGGQLVKGTVPLPGGATAIYNASGFGYFRHKDWLGSSRLATNWDHTVYSKEAYAPFGETENNMEQTSSTGQADRSFTGEDQDTTSGIFDYLFRRYDPVAGRWLSPDPKGWGAADISNPQSFNRYAYVLNNPMSLIDPNGLDCIYGGELDVSGNTLVIPGDCKDPNDNGVFVDATVTHATSDDDGNVASYETADGLFAGDGTPITATFHVTSYLFTGFDASVAPTTLTSAPTPFTPYIPTVPSNPRRPKQDCSQILKGAAVTVGLDAAGTFLGAIPGSGAVLVGLQVGVGLAGAANSAYHGDVGGTMAGTIGGAQLSAVAAGADQVGWTALKTFGGTAARALPWIGSAVSAYYFYKDATEALDSYQACKAGIGG